MRGSSGGKSSGLRGGETTARGVEVRVQLEGNEGRRWRRCEWRGDVAGGAGGGEIGGGLSAVLPRTSSTSPSCWPASCTRRSNAVSEPRRTRLRNPGAFERTVRWRSAGERWAEAVGEGGMLSGPGESSSTLLCVRRSEARASAGTTREEGRARWALEAAEERAEEDEDEVEADWRAPACCCSCCDEWNDLARRMGDGARAGTTLADLGGGKADCLDGSCAGGSLHCCATGPGDDVRRSACLGRGAAAVLAGEGALAGSLPPPMRLPRGLGGGAAGADDDDADNDERRDAQPSELDDDEWHRGSADSRERAGCGGGRKRPNEGRSDDVEAGGRGPRTRFDRAVVEGLIVYRRCSWRDEGRENEARGEAVGDEVRANGDGDAGRLCGARAISRCASWSSTECERRESKEERPPTTRRGQQTASKPRGPRTFRSDADGAQTGGSKSEAGTHRLVEHKVQRPLDA